MWLQIVTPVVVLSGCGECEHSWDGVQLPGTSPKVTRQASITAQFFAPDSQEVKHLRHGERAAE